MEIVLERVTKTRGAFRLGPIDLRVGSGEYAVLVGPNGAGKTTLLYLIAGFLAPDGGAIRLDGSDVATRPPERRDMAFIFSEPALFPHLTASQNVAFQPRSGPLDPAAIDSSLDLLGVRDVGPQYPGSLSSGQARRVEMARALASRPRALLLDEPYASIDPEDRGPITEAVKGLAAERGMTVLHVSHLEETAALGDTVLHLRHGGLERRESIARDRRG